MQAVSRTLLGYTSSLYCVGMHRVIIYTLNWRNNCAWNVRWSFGTLQCVCVCTHDREGPPVPWAHEPGRAPAAPCYSLSTCPSWAWETSIRATVSTRTSTTATTDKVGECEHGKLSDMGRRRPKEKKCWQNSRVKRSKETLCINWYILIHSDLQKEDTDLNLQVIDDYFHDPNAQAQLLQTYSVATPSDPLSITLRAWTVTAF